MATNAAGTRLAQAESRPKIGCPRVPSPGEVVQVSDTPDLGPLPRRVAVDVDQVRRLVAGQFPHWAGLPVERVANGGWDNWTFHLGSEMSVRLPSAFEYTEAVDKEHRWLPVFAPRIPLPISTPLAKGEPGEGYPYSWSIYRWLDGETARADRIADPVRFALDLAEFIVALQRVETADGPGPGQHNWYRGGTLRTFQRGGRRHATMMGHGYDISAQPLRNRRRDQSTVDASRR